MLSDKSRRRCPFDKFYLVDAAWHPASSPPPLFRENFQTPAAGRRRSRSPLRCSRPHKNSAPEPDAGKIVETVGRSRPPVLAVCLRHSSGRHVAPRPERRQSVRTCWVRLQSNRIGRSPSTKTIRALSARSEAEPRAESKAIGSI